jgi:hypothetical protein
MGGLNRRTASDVRPERGEKAYQRGCVDGCVSQSFDIPAIDDRRAIAQGTWEDIADEIVQSRRARK